MNKMLMMLIGWHDRCVMWMMLMNGMLVKRMMNMSKIRGLRIYRCIKAEYNLLLTLI